MGGCEQAFLLQIEIHNSDESPYIATTYSSAGGEGSNPSDELHDSREILKGINEIKLF